MTNNEVVLVDVQSEPQRVDVLVDVCCEVLRLNQVHDLFVLGHGDQTIHAVELVEQHRDPLVVQHVDLSLVLAALGLDEPLFDVAVVVDLERNLDDLFKKDRVAHLEDRDRPRVEALFDAVVVALEVALRADAVVRHSLKDDVFDVAFAKRIVEDSEDDKARLDRLAFGFDHARDVRESGQLGDGCVVVVFDIFPRLEMFADVRDEHVKFLLFEFIEFFWIHIDLIIQEISS